MALTPEEIYQQGFEALRDRLGLVGMIRFLQQISPGEGDYTKERREWLDRMSLDDVLALAKRRAAEKPKPKPKKRRSTTATRSRS